MVDYAPMGKPAAAKDILAVYSLVYISHREHFSGVLDYLRRKNNWRLHVCDPDPACGYGSARALTKAFRRFANSSFRAWRTSL